MSMHGNGLTKLMEECAELITEAAKLSAYPDGNHPDGKGPLLPRLEDEIADVLAAIRFVTQKHNLDQLRIQARTHRKLEKYFMWETGEIHHVQV